MAKYHINKNTGVPTVCNATKKPCPNGGEHFNTQKEAQEFLDDVNIYSKSLNTFKNDKDKTVEYLKNKKAAVEALKGAGYDISMLSEYKSYKSDETNSIMIAKDKKSFLKDVLDYDTFELEENDLSEIATVHYVDDFLEEMSEGTWGELNVYDIIDSESLRRELISNEELKSKIIKDLDNNKMLFEDVQSIFENSEVFKENCTTITNDKKERLYVNIY